MGHVVVAFDVIEVYGFSDPWLLIQVHKVALKILVIYNPPHVAFEMSVIYGIEAHEGAEEPPIRFDDPGSKQETLRGQARLELIQRNEECATRLLVSSLSVRET
jgi:hypothetical protein